MPIQLDNVPIEYNLVDLPHAAAVTYIGIICSQHADDNEATCYGWQWASTQLHAEQSEPCTQHNTVSIWAARCVATHP